MQNIEFIVSLAASCLGLLVTATTFIVKFIKSLKEKRTAQNTIKICDALSSFVAAAEKFTNYSGAEKKEFALTRVNQFAISNKMPFDIKLIESKLEELVSLTKQVNAKERMQSLVEDKNFNSYLTVNR